MPQLDRQPENFRVKRPFFQHVFEVALVAAALLASPFAAAAEGADEGYGATLATLYGERYWIQAYKDVCVSVIPKSRRELQSAYEEWMERHEQVIESLETRFAAMVKQASRDQKDFDEKYNAAHNEVMKQREESKANLRKLPKEELLKQCQELPAFLRSEKSNMPNTHPKEFEAIYGKSQ
jgi:hypothetical protein